MRTIWLHIGTEKTGSSSIQRMLERNASWLSENDVGYVRGLGGALRRLAARGLPKDGASVDEKLARIRNNAVVASSEHLQSQLRKDDQIERLRDELRRRGFDDIRVIIYLRDPAHLVNSMASTAVQWDKELLQEPLSPFLDWVCDHRRTLELWVNVFGRRAVAPRLFIGEEFAGGSLESDFLQCVGINGGPRIPVGRVNSQISHTGIEIMRHVNATLSDSDWGLSDRERRTLRRALYREVELRFASPRYSQAGYLWRYYDRQYAASNERVRQLWFPDRDRLFPSYSPPPATQPDISVETAAAVGAALVSTAVTQVGG